MTTIYRFMGGDILRPVNGGVDVSLTGTTSPPANVAPSAPGSLTASAVSATSLLITWSAATDTDGTVDRYEVRVNGSLVGATSALLYTVTGLTEATEYAVSVRAVDNDGQAGPAATAIGLTLEQSAPSEITHGRDLTEDHVGPWSLQGVTRGSEVLSTPPTPSWQWGFRMEDPNEFAVSGTYVYNNDPTNLGGIVPAGGLTIDGYFFPAGTRVVQFRDLSVSGMYAQGVSGHWLFRGCRWRYDWADGGSTFNDYTATYTNALHYCDMGATNANAEGGAFWKSVGGTGHRVYRTMCSETWTGMQPNTPGFDVIETIIQNVTFPYGTRGTSGGDPFNATMAHTNGLSAEGSMHDLRILRCKILVPSPDVGDGVGVGTAPGQVGYGTQPGQDGYSAGTEPGRSINQTDCIALFAITGRNHDIEVSDNYLGGSGYVIYAGNADGQASGIVMRGNEITTRWWTNGGYHGAVTDQPAWGANGNISEGNTWADDYGTGGNGATAPAGRQYPNGDGPRAGQTVF